MHGVTFIVQQLEAAPIALQPTPAPVQTSVQTQTEEPAKREQGINTSE
jgi:hypothetical protein